MIPNPQPNISDTIKTDNTTWSSNKIDAAIAAGGQALIDDTNIGTDKVWSSSKVFYDVLQKTEHTTIRQSLEAGDDTWTLVHDDITATAMIDIYTSDYDIVPVSVTTDDENHTLTITFDTLESDLDVAVIIWKR